MLTLAIAFGAAAAAAALASTGALSDGGYVGDETNNTAGCAQQAKGLDGVFAVAVSADGRSLYVPGSLDNALVLLDRS